MEQHPVPQNVTGFQFKLIGDMTIRQFLYLAAGVLLGFVFWQFDLPLIIKGILAGGAAGAGLAFAFMPIEERPLDRWLTSFLKSIYRPTQFLWKKNAPAPEVLINEPVKSNVVTPANVLRKEQTAARVEEYLASLKPQTLAPNDLDKKETLFLNQTLNTFQTAQSVPTTSFNNVIPAKAGIQAFDEDTNKSGFPIRSGMTTAATQSPTTNNLVPPPPPPIPEPLVIETAPPVPPPSQEAVLEQKIKNVITQLEDWNKKLNDQNLTKFEFIEIQAQMAYLLKEKERLTRELVKLRKAQMQKMGMDNRLKNLDQKNNYAFGNADSAGLPKTTTFPNTPSGVVKTKTGNLLPGILVEIRNSEGLPVRALKTGKLGQFSVTSSLPNGAYTIYLEDPQKTYFFDIIDLPVKGDIIPALEIFAKTKKDQEREELSKKIFGSPSLRGSVADEAIST